MREADGVAAVIWLQLAAGLLLLLAGGEALVRGSVAVATRLGLSPLVIGLTLVGLGTSAPELVACIEAALIGAPGLAVGNIVGSNIANILLILGISALLLPVATKREAFTRDGAVLAATTIVFVAVVTLAGAVGRGTGIAFLALLAAYLVWTYVTERRAPDAAGVRYAEEAEEVMPRGMPLWAALAFAVGGIAAVVFGADLLVRGAIEIAREVGLSETVIGLTLVAVGTSLPELATSIVAAARRHTDVAFGNVVGSNIFNVLGIAGATAIVAPFDVPAEVLRLDIWVMLATVALLAVFAVTGWRISRREGAVLLLAYVGYLLVQFMGPGTAGPA